MADLLFVFVRENAAQAQALAAALANADLSISAETASSALASSSAGVIVWSDAATRSDAFLAAAQRVINAGKAVIVCFSPPPSRRLVGETPTFDLSGWKDDAEDAALAPLLLAVNYIVASKRDEVLADELGARAASWTADLPETPLGRMSAEVRPLRPAPDEDEDPGSAGLVA